MLAFASKVSVTTLAFTGIFQGSKCPSLPGLTHWVNPGLPGWVLSLIVEKVGNTGE